MKKILILTVSILLCVVMTGCEPDKIYVNQTLLSTQTVVSYSTITNMTTSTATITLPAITEKTTSTKTEISTLVVYTINSVTNTETATKTDTTTSTVTNSSTVTTTTTIIPGFPAAPIPEYDAEHGAILGRVIYTNGNPVSTYYVIRFDVGSMFSFHSTYTDQNGYYVFNNVNPDQYEIYVFETEPTDSISRPPNAVVTVSAGQITTVQNIII